MKNIGSCNFSEVYMEYFEKPKIFACNYGILYANTAAVYREGTLYKIGDRGLIVIQQYYEPRTKSTYWGPVEASMRDLIYTNAHFREYFDIHADMKDDGDTYPFVTLRQIMRGLGMKPLRKEPWETRFF